MGKQLEYKLLPFDEKLNVLTHAISLLSSLVRRCDTIFKIIF